IYRLSGTQITLTAFRSELAAAADGTASTVSINYNPDPAGITEFNICRAGGSAAPTNVVAVPGNFDAGATADDVRLTCTAPTATSAIRTFNAGFANTLDTGDKITIDFSEPMSIAINAIIRLTDSDCGPAGNGGPATCSGANSNSVVDIVCASNATCTLQD